MDLCWPTERELPSYVSALESGWSPNTMDDGAGRAELAAIAADPVAFLRSLVDLDATGGPIPLPDGTFAERLPGYRKWMWDGEFCGSISFRWRPGTEELPPHVLGHIGYSVVPWKRRNGYATDALRQLLPEAAEHGLSHVEITTDIDNVASQRVIEANGGTLVERFAYPAEYQRGDALRYRVDVHDVSGTSCT
jgi:predicted acetyltransferase